MSAYAPKLLCLDMDGTVYQDKRIYPRIIDYFFSGTPYAPLIEETKAMMEDMLAGHLSFQCGSFAPKEPVTGARSAGDLLPAHTVAALLTPDPAPWTDRSLYSYVSDGWTLAMYLARRIGWEGDAFWAIFAQARADLLTEALGPVPDPAFAQTLRKLRKAGLRLLLCSNARTEPGLALLERLGLADCFDEVCFEADKPHSFPRRIADWSDTWGIAPAEMLFVGDQGYFDLYAGQQAGAQTLLVSPNYVADAALWDMRLQSLPQLTAALNTLV